MHRHFLIAALAAIPFATLRADFTYEETSKITGGSLMGMMKFAGAFSKDARKISEPTVSTTSIKGNRMVHRSADMAQIIDLDRETITRVDYTKRTYSVVTFEQMRQAMEDMSKKMQSSPNANATAPAPAGNAPNVQDVKFDISMKD